MDPHRPPEDERLQDVPLDLLHRQHHDQRHDRGEHALRHQRHDDRERTRDHGADERDEGEQEDEHGQRDGHRHVEEVDAEADEDGVDQRDDHRAAHIGGQRPPGARAGPGHTRAGGRGHQLQRPLPDAPAVVEQEERREGGEQDAGERLDHDRDALESRRGYLVGVGADRLAQALGDLVDLLVGDVEGAVQQPVAQFVDAVLDLVGEVVDVLHDLPGDEPADQAHHHEAQDRRQGGGRPPGHPVPAQPGHGRLQQRRDQQRGHERQHHQLYGADDAHQHPQRAREHQQPPPRLRGHPHAPGHGLRRIGAVVDDDRVVLGEVLLGGVLGQVVPGARHVAGHRPRPVVGVVPPRLLPALLQPLAHVRQSGAEPAEPPWHS